VVQLWDAHYRPAYHCRDLGGRLGSLFWALAYPPKGGLYQQVCRIKT
jgi:hypothetical protein